MSKRAQKEVNISHETDGKKQKTIETPVVEDLASKELKISEKNGGNAAPETKESDIIPSSPVTRRVRNPALVDLVPSPLSDRVILNSMGTQPVKVTMNVEIFCINKSPVFVVLLPQSSGLADDKSLSDFIRGKMVFRTSLFKDPTNWIVSLVKAESEWNTPGAYVTNIAGMPLFIKTLKSLKKDPNKYRSIFMIFAGEATIKMQNTVTEEVVLNVGNCESDRFLDFLDWFLETLDKFRFEPAENYFYSLVVNQYDIPDQNEFGQMRTEIHAKVKEQQKEYALRYANRNATIDPLTSGIILS
jgi:hypothetical protein